MIHESILAPVLQGQDPRIQGHKGTRGDTWQSTTSSGTRCKQRRAAPRVPQGTAGAWLKALPERLEQRNLFFFSKPSLCTNEGLK